MLYLKTFTFNPFQENTYLLYNEENKAFIIDPGNSDASENKMLSDFIAGKKLKIESLLLTHGHIDHVMGNRYVYDTYGFKPRMHKDDLPFVQRVKESAAMYGVNAEASPLPETFITAGETIHLGKHAFKVIFAPGHSPGSICFYCAEQKLLMAGDVLFRESIGRTDLPMGDHETLLNSIKTQLFVLPDDTKVFPGHGPSTTIGHEKQYNPFLS